MASRSRQMESQLMIAKTTIRRKLREHERKLKELRETIGYNNEDGDLEAMQKHTRSAVDEVREVKRCEQIISALEGFSDKSQYADLVKLMTQMNKRLTQREDVQSIDSFLSAMGSKSEDPLRADEELKFLEDFLPESNVLQYKEKFCKVRKEEDK